MSEFKDKKCLECNKIMKKSDPKYRTVTKDGWDKKKYCNMKCLHASKMVERNPNIPNEKVCPKCEKSFPRPKKFSKVKNEEIYISDHEWMKKVFCSRKCQTLHITHSYSPLTPIGQSASYQHRNLTYMQRNKK